MLPIFDLDLFTRATPTERKAIADDIGAACETMGFFYVKNHGLTPELIDHTRDMARSFFALGNEQKRRYQRQPGHYRGYIPVSEFTPATNERPPVLYEAFLIGDDIAEDDPAITSSNGMLVPNAWPSEPAGFTNTLQTYQDGVRNIATTLLEAFSLALNGSNANELARFFTQPLSNISLLHYLPSPVAQSPAAKKDEGHFDTNAITVLLPGKVGGLEARQPDGTWIEVPPIDGCFVVNIGNMMACWSGGRFKSTMHRVVPPPGVERYSIGYFAVPDYDVIVRPLDTGRISDASFCKPIHTGEDLARFVASCDAMVEIENPA